MTTIRIVLAEDHTLMRAGVRALLQQIEGITVVGEAGDGREALRQVAEIQPDLVLMDISMTGLNGLEATARLKKDFPHVRVVILSMHANEEYVLQAMRAGAVGYLLKDAGTAELELALRSVARGETYLSPAVSKHIIQGYLQRAEEVPDPLEQLTPRQREILQLIAEGRTMKEIAQLLTISIKTVEAHRTQIMERLDIHDITGLVRFAIRVGLVTLDT